MRQRSPYWLRNSTKRPLKRGSATIVRIYFLRQRSTVRESHSPGHLCHPRTLRQRDKTKANWDFHKTRVLLSITASLIDNGHRRRNCLSPSGYNKLLADFNCITSQSLTLTQIKSRMVQLGKDWRTWMDLKSSHSRVTKMGWNAKTNTWDAPDWWWATQQQRNPQIMKFRARGLEHAELMEKVFGESTATGEYHWTPSARIPPPEDGQASGMQEHAELVASSSPPIVADPYNQSNVGNGSGSGVVRRRRDGHDDTNDGYSGFGWCQSHVAHMCQSIADMADAVRGRTNEVRLVWADRPNSMQACVEKLLAMESIDSTPDLYLFAIDLFMTEVNREAFMAQPDDAHKMRCLLYQQRKHERTHRPIYSVPPYPYYPPLGPYMLNF